MSGCNVENFYITAMQKQEDEDIDLTHLIVRIWRRKLFAAIIAVICFAGAFAYTKLASKFYETSIKFVYQSAAKQNQGLSAIAALAGIPSKGNTDDGSAYMEDIIKSADFLSQFADKKWLISDTSKIADTLNPITLEDFWKIELDSTAIDKEKVLQAVIIETLKGKYIKYKQDKKTQVISITTSFEDPKLSYDFNVALFEELNNTLANRMHFKVSENRKFIEERLSEVKSDLRKSEGILLDFKQRNRSWNDPSIQLQESRLIREVTLNQELAIQLQKQYELAKIEEAKDMPLLDVIESPSRALRYSKPKKKIIMAAGVAGGIAVGLIFALLLDLWCTERKSLMQRLSAAQKEFSA